MKTWQLNEAKTHLSKLVDAAAQGEEIIIARYGKPLARLVPYQENAVRPLGFFPIVFRSDLLAPTDQATLDEFEGAEDRSG
ncbi:type II toxin-antitoxin system Phd/YefM family antitoxin (plasmid) [Deinococcus radiomollis]|uniref:type II toxin-antitoxin system Phd/YefM family antitoxin n=1 Tax=Deinococcus radiomollis TaxID=468916 RepID=UPI00389230FF